MENNNLENMTYHQLDEQLMEIVLNINRLDFNRIKYVYPIHGILFNEDKVKLYNRLKRCLEDTDDYIKFINSYNKYINYKNELEEIINNTTKTDFIDAFERAGLVKLRYNEDKDALFNKFIKEYQPYFVMLYVKFYKNKDVHYLKLTPEQIRDF
jgi:hypothetical protein